MLLVHQLNTGNLNPTEIDWASSQLRGWSRRLALEQIPKSLEGFFVDLAGREGLVRRTGNDRGSVLRYLDTTPLADGIDRAIAALRDARSAPTRDRSRRSISSGWRYCARSSQRFHRPRTPSCGAIRASTVAVSARVRIGLSRICQDLAARTSTK